MRLFDTLLMLAFIILSEAKNLIDSGTYTLEILRLTPQNDVVGQAVNPALEKRILLIDPTL